MLSVLIPVYNRDIKTLVQALSQQLSTSGISYEILIADDASDESYDEQSIPLTKLPNLQYHRHKENMGRARIRNWLAANARYPYLLFIDCDATVISGDFINSYMKAVDQMKGKPSFVISGGIAYRKEPPEKNQHLRWYYGTKREQIPASIRQNNPYKSFTPFNVLLTKNIFDILSFYEDLTTYGYEDTFFGLQLQRYRIPVLHIDNPLRHDGLDENTIYIQKIESSIDNLVLLSESGLVNDKFTEGHKLLKTYFRLKSLHALKIVARIYSLSGNKIKEYLTRNSNLFLLDFYKLGYLTQKFSK